MELFHGCRRRLISARGKLLCLKSTKKHHAVLRAGAPVLWLWETTLFGRSRVQIPALYTEWTWNFTTVICCKNCFVCLKRRKWIKKRPGWPILTQAWKHSIYFWLLGQSSCIAKPQVTLTAPNCDHFARVSLMVLDFFWMQLPKLKN